MCYSLHAGRGAGLLVYERAYGIQVCALHTLQGALFAHNTTMHVQTIKLPCNCCGMAMPSVEYVAVEAMLVPLQSSGLAWDPCVLLCALVFAMP